LGDPVNPGFLRRFFTYPLVLVAEVGHLKDFGIRGALIDSELFESLSHSHREPDCSKRITSAEPSLSYEEESCMMGREEDVEDEFHRKSTSTRRDGGGTFRRSSTSSVDSTGPSFISMTMKQQRQESAGSSRHSQTRSISRPGVSFPVQGSPALTDTLGIGPVTSVRIKIISGFCAWIENLYTFSVLT
jgi:hypothetical protein